MFNLRRPPHTAVICSALLALAALPSHALVSLNDGRDKFYVSASASLISDSNFYANKFGYSETILATNLTAEYSRRAGEIGVDASVGMNLAAHDTNASENYQNPFFKAELTKGTGRTTGSLSLKAARENGNDAAANLRNQSWNYGSALNVHYPVIERYSINGSVGYDGIDYQDNRVMYDLDSFMVRSELNYSIDSQREFLAGYRFRTELSSGPADFNDHDFFIGLKGSIIPKLIGTLRVGYQIRDQKRSDNQYSGLSAMAATTWVITKQTNVSLMLLKDFRTTSTDIASDILTGSVQVNRVLNPRWTVGAGASAGRTRFIGANGFGRHDTFVSWNAQITYSANEHFRLSLNYVYSKNYSTLSFADYGRDQFTLVASTRW